MSRRDTDTKRAVALYAHTASFASQVSDAGIMHVLIDDGQDGAILVGTPAMIVRFCGQLMKEVVDTTEVWAAETGPVTKP